MRNLHLGRLSLLAQRHPENLQLAEDVQLVLKEVPDDEKEDEKVGREAAEELWPNRPFSQENSKIQRC